MFLGLVCVCALACDDSDPFVFEAVIVGSDGGNPAAGTDANTLRVEIQEGELPARDDEFPIADGSFDAILEFESFVVPTRIRLALEGNGTDLITAPPEFVPSLSGGLMRVVTTEPASCARIAFDQMEAPRTSFAMVQSDTFALVAGGTEPSLEQVEFLDVLEWVSGLFAEQLSLPTLGPTRGAAIDDTRILVLPEEATAFVFDMGDPTSRVTPLVLHPGAGPASALVSVPGVGAFVIGGDIGGETQSSISVVDVDGNVGSRSLSTPRAGAAATRLGANILIVGGNAAGDAEILLDGQSTGEPTASLADGVRNGGLLVGDGSSRALLLGGSSTDGSVRQDTVSFEGCPDACESATGPSWTEARLDALQPSDSTLIIGGTSSTSIDEVRFEDGGPEIAKLFDLVVPRANAAGIVLESGAFIVGGGTDGVSPRDDFEFCAPVSLSPLE